MKILRSLAEGADFVFQNIDSDIKLAAPLGVGKPNQLLNLIYEQAVKDTSRRLEIFTALSLQPPKPTEDLAKRFLEPFAKRQWGDDYPVLKYSKDAVANKVPPHIQVHEFYFLAGSALKSSHLQRHYQSINYTHVAENVFNANINVIVQMVAKRDGKYSLSTNPDVTLDVVEMFKKSGKKILAVGVVHPELPYMDGDAEVDPEFFDAIVESPEVTHQIFALPRLPITLEDHLIGFYASQLMRDGGTIQIGIGSLSDAVVAALVLRHTHNSLYKKTVANLKEVAAAAHDKFELGLYGLTEMLTDGFMYLHKSGILHRTVTDETTGRKTFLHGSFILGSKPFYKWLRELRGEDAQGLRMTRVSKVNDLYDPNETRLRAQRVHPRFFNTTMQVTLLGECMSETLSDGGVVSGVGGQYNFVAMAHELKDSRSIIMLRSWKNVGGKCISNILWEPGHITIPRHLRDVVVTEYGVADLRGKSDEACIQALLNVCDSRFQDELMEKAKKARKLQENYQIPEKFRNNTPGQLLSLRDNNEINAAFPYFPFGSDFTPEEERIAIALSVLQEDKKLSLVKVLKNAFSNPRREFPGELARLQLDQPKSFKDRLYRRLLTSYLDKIPNIPDKT